MALSVLLAAGVGASVCIAASGARDHRALVPRHGFLVGEFSGRLRVLSHSGDAVRHISGSLGKDGPQGIALAAGRRRAFVSVLRGDRPPHLYRVNLATGEKRWIANGISPVLDRQRRRLAYVSVVRSSSDILYRRALIVRNLRTGEKRRISLGPGIPLGTPPDNIINWSPTGRSVAFYDDAHVRLARLGATEDPISEPVAPRYEQAPVFLNSHRLVVLANCCIGRHQHLVAIDLRTGRSRRFATLGAPPENLARVRRGHLLAVTALGRLTAVSRHHTREIAKGIAAAAR